MKVHQAHRQQRSQHPDRLPRDKRTGQPIGPMAQPGYYPGYETLSQQKFWDAATRSTILRRVNEPSPIRFFDPDELRMMEAITARIIPQDDRDEAHRIPIVSVIDHRLYEGTIDGYRFEDMPPDQEAYHLGLRGIDALARHLFQQPFADLDPAQQERVLVTLHDANPPAGQEFWRQMSVERFWLLLVQDCIEGYYAHPYSWDEIGFGGPAYPRGYMRLEHGKPEPWEKDEQRYDWLAPEWSISDRYTPLGGSHPRAVSAGQEGTH